jgi:3',5'-cyclic AMP phosphodiesterase CpdA
VVGNHDLAFVFENGKIALDARGKKVLAKAPPSPWRAQFTLPENGPLGLEELAYHLDYQGVRLIVINSNDRLAEQAAWLEPLLAANPSRWTIVAFHHPVYSAGRDRDDKETREAFLALFDKYHVDLVLTGHDHSYARTKPVRGGAPVGPDERGTVYLVSSSGPKFYTVNSGYAALMAKTAGNLQLFQAITVDGPRLRFRSIAADGELNDAFELMKPSPAAP